ncbi:MAG TPA: hypothetical protein VHM19_16745, partial [Polyangiales bacterium]|nr:hypothetical protein [Polyangiales bacterium]
MLVSRFWYILLSVAAAAAMAAALLAQGKINGKATEAVGDQLHRDRVMLDTALRLEARARIDRIAFITVDNKLGSLLRQARGVSDEKALGKIGGEAKDVLRSHVARMVEAAGDNAKEADLAPDIAFALDAEGRIIAQLGPLEVNPPGSSLATYPLVDRALHGYLRDDVWVYDRRVYRMAARPVLYGGEYVGAIVHGYKFDNAFAEKLSQSLGGHATLVFFYGTNTLASYAPPEGGAPIAEIVAPLSQTLNDEHLKAGDATEPQALQSGGRAEYSLMVGGGALVNVGYAIARPLVLMAQPTELLQNASQQDIQALPVPLLGGAAAVLALLGLLFVYLERDRPYKVLLGKLDEIVKGERDRLLVTEWRGAYRKLTDRINQAIDKSVEKAAEAAPTTKKKANLDEILGPTPQTSAEPYFGFADNGSAAPQPPAPAPRSAPNLP